MSETDDKYRRDFSKLIYARTFRGKYEHPVITGGIGHNLSQEAPQDFAQAVSDVAGF
jgi:hypothetical protein